MFIFFRRTRSILSHGECNGRGAEEGTFPDEAFRKRRDDLGLRGGMNVDEGARLRKIIVGKVRGAEVDEHRFFLVQQMR